MDKTNTAPAYHATLIVEPKGNGDTWLECRTCGACQWLSRSRGVILHRSLCRTRAQIDTPAAPTPAVAPDALDRHARNVRRTGLTRGRDEDTYQAVRAGYLSESAAMNSDD